MDREVMCLLSLNINFAHYNRNQVKLKILGRKMKEEGVYHKTHEAHNPNISSLKAGYCLKK